MRNIKFEGDEEMQLTVRYVGWLPASTLFCVGYRYFVRYSGYIFCRIFLGGIIFHGGFCFGRVTKHLAGHYIYLGGVRNEIHFPP